ncbi:MAG: hypothetical protein WCH34_05780 [Bacteroidota bacterium]
MKKNDLVFILILIVLLLPFFMSVDVYNFYCQFNKEHGLITGFIKFAILSTLGESIGLRIKKGVYNEPGFGLLPKAIVWGFLGISIVAAFSIFKNGTPAFLEYLGFKDAKLSLKGDFSSIKLLTAFSISVAMNVVFAPVMMTFHKITDTHIHRWGGSIKSLTKPIRFGEILKGIDWKVQWGFVFARTIPLFWIPAHTITFLLPDEFQILFAALLSVFLGILLSIAALKAEKNKTTI